MDRVTVQYGQVPLETDMLQAERFVMTALAKLSEAVLGTLTAVAGFTLGATATPSLSCTLSAGQIYEVENLEVTAWSSLGVDTHSILKQGILLDPQTLTFTPPTTNGYAQYALVEATYLDADTGAVVRPYYNATNPTVPFSGPGNAGSADNTIRRGTIQIAIKYGIAATAGSQIAPTADSGYAPLFLVSLAFGQTTIGAANISVAPNAPFIPVPLPGVPSGVQTGAWVVGQATPSGPVVTNSPTTAQIAAANTYASTLFSTAAYPFTLVPGMEILVYFGQGISSTSPVLNVNGSGNLPMLRQSGGAPSSGNSANGTPPDISGWVSFVLRGDKGAWLINGLSISDTKQIVLNVQRTQIVADRGTQTQSVPTGVNTIITNYGTATVQSQGGSTFANGLLTVGPGDAGLWFVSFHARQSITGTSGFTNGLYINGSATPVITGGANGNSSGAATIHGTGARLLNLNAGDQVTVGLIQTTGSTVTFNDLYDFSAVRLGAS